MTIVAHSVQITDEATSDYHIGLSGKIAVLVLTFRCHGGSHQKKQESNAETGLHVVCPTDGTLGGEDSLAPQAPGL